MKWKINTLFVEKKGDVKECARVSAWVEAPLSSHRSSFAVHSLSRYHFRRTDDTFLQVFAVRQCETTLVYAPPLTLRNNIKGAN